MQSLIGPIKTKPYPRDIRGKIARTIAHYRRQRSLTLFDLSELTGIHWRSIQRFEAGEGEFPVRKLESIANALGMPLHELLRLSENF